jgi:hypothetical protein
MDLQDYVNSNLIGPGNEAADCTAREDMGVTARATKDAFLKSVKELYLAAFDGLHDFDSPVLVSACNFYNDDYLPSLIQMEIALARLWNSWYCPDSEEKRTGIQPGEMTKLQPTNPGEPFESSGAINDSKEVINYVIDYDSAQVYNETLLNEYKVAHTNLLCNIKKLIAFSIDWDWPEGNVEPDTPVNDYCSLKPPAES